jgi:hypothetical protein
VTTKSANILQKESKNFKKVYKKHLKYINIDLSTQNKTYNTLASLQTFNTQNINSTLKEHK